MINSLNSEWVWRILKMLIWGRIPSYTLTHWVCECVTPLALGNCNQRASSSSFFFSSSSSSSSPYLNARRRPRAPPTTFFRLRRTSPSSGSRPLQVFYRHPTGHSHAFYRPPHRIVAPPAWMPLSHPLDLKAEARFVAPLRTSFNSPPYLFVEGFLFILIYISSVCVSVCVYVCLYLCLCVSVIMYIDCHPRLIMMGIKTMKPLNGTRCKGQLICILRSF